MGRLRLRGQLTGRHCSDMWDLHFLEAVSKGASAGLEAAADPPHLLPKSQKERLTAQNMPANPSVPRVKDLGRISCPE